MNWLPFLSAVNDVLTAGVGATAFALLLYFYFYNRESRVARTFSGLLACLLIVYLVDILLTGTPDLEMSVWLLRVQWLGIAFTPTLYLEFTRAIRLAVQEDRFPRWLRLLSATVSGGVALLAIFSDLVVHDGVVAAGALHLRPGPVFYPFALLFALTTGLGLQQTLAARSRTYTRAAHRRMTYLLIGFVAPALGIFPYLLFIGWPSSFPDILLWILLILGNLAIAAMLALMAYSVAFIGTLTPERVIKHRLVRFLLRGPATALLALAAFGVGLTAERALGLTQYTLSLVAVAGSVILAQLAVELGKPLLDVALYREGRDEVARIQDLSQRLLTTADLRQFLENILAAMCELLQSEGGFVAALEGDELQREIWCGIHISREEVAAFPIEESTITHQEHGFVIWNDYWVAPMYDKAGEQLLGLIGLRAPQASLPLSPDQEVLLEQLLLQARVALDDRRLQQVLFLAFSPLIRELEEIQRRRGMLRYNGQAESSFSLDSLDLPERIHDALAHYWGGPRLTENPLLQLRIVQQAAAEHDGDPIKGLRAILTTAIERLRPDGARKLTAPEWLLYNILEMKFLRGHKVREVAMRLAVSESDFYRKQRVAIENLARIIADMEVQALEEDRGLPRVEPLAHGELDTL